MPPVDPARRQWRFEALDLRAGIGIALWREQRRPEWGLPPEQPAALYFSPPHFQPEPIVNTVVALAACRGMFQPGLYIDAGGEVEASFATPAEVAEFLRRCYVNGAGGDGTDGGGTPGPTPPPAGGDGPLPEGLGPRHSDSRMIATMRKRCEDFAYTARQLQDGEATGFSWSDVERSDARDQTSDWDITPGDALVLGDTAVELVLESMRRMPAAHDRPAWLGWYDNLRLLTYFLAAMGVAQGMNADRERYLTPIVRGSALFQHDQHPDTARFDQAWLFLFGPYLDAASDIGTIMFLAHRYRHAWLDWPVLQVMPTGINIGDPLDALARIALPVILHGVLPADARNHASVFHLLNVVVSDTQIISHSLYGRHALGVALFAAACIAATPVPGTQAGFVSFHSGENQRMMRALEQGHAWLIEHLPRFAFSNRHEEIIGGVKTIRYPVTNNLAGGVVDGNDVNGQPA